MSNNIKIVIGSWGSYNECNERALGSKWLDLSDKYRMKESVKFITNIRKEKKNKNSYPYFCFNST